MVAPAVFFLYYLKRSPGLRAVAADAFNFEVPAYLLLASATILGIRVIGHELDRSLLGFSVYLVSLPWIAWIVVSSTVRAWRGQSVRYPLRLPLLRRSPPPGDP